MANLFNLQRTRNIGIAAHVDAGKTTLTERILFYAGTSYKIGEVHDGTAHMDYLAEEQQHGITITSAVTRAHWDDHLIQLVDTPGHVDFTIEVERVMRILDGCIIVLDGVRGVEPQTETIWRQRDKFAIPCLFFINKMDRPGADFSNALESIGRRLSAAPIPITVPLPGTESIIHLIDKRILHFEGDRGNTVKSEECDQTTWRSVSEFHENMLLGIADADEKLADEVLADQEPQPAAIWAALRRTTLSGKVHPCFAGAAFKNIGIQPLLDGVIKLLPSPLDRPPSIAFTAEGEEQSVTISNDGPLVALAFKVQMWEKRRQVFARIYRNSIKAGDSVSILRGNGKHINETVARIYDIDAGHRTKLDKAMAGQIVLLSGLRYTTTGDTLCDPRHLLALERIETKEPVLSLAIEPSSSRDEEKLLEILDKLEQEDPTLHLHDDDETGQRLLCGMGELHLQIVVERIQREFNLNVHTGKPAVALRETITKTAEADVLFETPLELASHAMPLKARVAITASPRARSSGIEISLDPATSSNGHELSPLHSQAIENGIRIALSNGPCEGVSLEDLEIKVKEVELFGASSTSEALQAAAAKATSKAIKDGNPNVLHPIVTSEIIVPEENLGTVLGDLESRCATILNTEKRGGNATTIACEVALDKILGYSTDLRSMTHGRGQFSIVFNRFDRI